MTTQGDDQDKQDLAACAQGDEDAFARLFSSHGGKIYGLALRTLRREDLADDVVQETFMQLHRKAHTFRGEAKVSTWLSAIAINACRMKLRKQKRTTVSLDQAAELASDPPAGDSGLTDALDAIEPDARDALIANKADVLRQRLQTLWPRAELNITHRWAGTFDTTRDGLPLIGPVSDHPNLFAAYGYGGNGITFSYLAAQLLGDLIDGKRSPLLDDFALDRNVPA